MSHPAPVMPASRHCPALFITAPASGLGKTTVVAGLARYHHQRGRRVRVFKTGPDFLDPMILSHASAAPVEPLDLWMVGTDDCRRKLWTAAGSADVILIEGAMGLFDGNPSGADLAELCAIPIAALIDGRGMGQTFGAVALGLATYRPSLQFAGVLANRVASPRHEAMLRQGLPTTLRYLGALPRLSELPRRHLGLVQAGEIADLDARLNAIAASIADTALAELPPAVTFPAPPPAPALPPLLAGCRIAVARDAAFSFIYSDNLDCLAALGAELHFFSPLTDSAVSADAIYLPGGYPELHLTQLAANHGLKRALSAHLAAHRPIYAECGGMLYLLEQLTDQAGHSAALAGVLPGQAQLRPHLVGLGMQSLTTAAGCLRGHSFHHSAMTTSLVPNAVAVRQHDGSAGEPFYQHGSVRASYLHLYFPAAPAAAAALFLP